MNLVLSLLFHVLKPLGTNVNYDGVMFDIVSIRNYLLVIVGIGVLVLIVLGVRYLIRLRNKKSKHD